MTLLFGLNAEGIVPSSSRLSCFLPGQFCHASSGFAGNPSSLSCGMSGLQPHGSTGVGQMYQQQVHQGMQQGVVASHPAYQGPPHFSDDPAYADRSNAGSMACLYQNYQVGAMSSPPIAFHIHERTFFSSL